MQEGGYASKRFVMLVDCGEQLIYEFKHPMSDRLTDEAWRELLESDPPDNVEWYANFGL